MVPESLLLTFPMVCYNSWFLNFKEFLQAELHADVNSKLMWTPKWDSLHYGTGQLLQTH